MRERNEALDCYVYARAAASAAGLDRFEERHWRNWSDNWAGQSASPRNTTSNRSTRATQRGGLAVLATVTPVGA